MFIKDKTGENMPGFDGVLIGAFIACIAALISALVAIFKFKNKIIISIVILLVLVALVIGICVLARHFHWESDILGISDDNSTFDSIEDYSENNNELQETDTVSRCAEENHGSVKNSEELDGFFIKNPITNSELYYNSIKSEFTGMDSQEPLHHIFIDIQSEEYNGMSVDIGLWDANHSLQIVESFDGSVIELYISEGRFEIGIVSDEGGHLKQVADTILEIDHCGIYTIDKLTVH